MPGLERFHNGYGQDRFAILGIHSQQEVEKLDDYLRTNPKPWPNVPDSSGELAKTFAVKRWPSVYLFDRQGTLRVAIPFRPGLESAIEKLLEER